MNGLPTLSIFGITTDSRIITEKLFLYYTTSDYSQSVTFYGKIKSLKKTIHDNWGNEDMMITSIKNDLEEMYSYYFKEVEVDVDIKENDDGIRTLSIDITTVDSEGSVNRLNESLGVDNAGVKQLDVFLYR